ncbi:hypothetical protein ROA7450_01423 [Roseovarius albus]|uniref:Uncharacterized protein n=1 Tax=Roseovarius albus TaxID=1247867 RepID=A0A1X6YVB0_9RHOB|nr:hypothetical protein ROA7450_01423 [Roseovarius albus]
MRESVTLVVRIASFKPSLSCLSCLSRLLSGTGRRFSLSILELIKMWRFRNVVIRLNKDLADTFRFFIEVSSVELLDSLCAGTLELGAAMREIK